MTEDEIGNNESNIENKWYFIQLFNIVIICFCIYCAKNQFLPFTNHFIPDATFYEDHVMFSINRGLLDGFTQINKFLYSLGPQSFVFYNTFLLLLSIRLCTIFKVFSNKSVTWARAIIVFNPYFLISVMGPSKECNLTFLSLLSLYFFQKNGLLFKGISFAVALVIIFIRPQFGVCLFLAFLIFLLLRIFSKPMVICWLILVTFFILNSIPYINELIVQSQGGDELPFFSGSMLYELALVLQLMSKNPLLQIPAFIAKMCLVMFTPVARPNPIRADFIPLLDWGYTFMANVLFPMNFAFLLLFLYPDLTKKSRIGTHGQFLVLYCFIGFMSVIISPSIQFRYLFPYSPIIAACFALHRTQIRNRIWVISFIITLIFFVLTAIWLPKEWDYTNIVPVFLSWL